MQDATSATKQYQRRHIFTDGHRCGSSCQGGGDLCYYHHPARKPVANSSVFFDPVESQIRDARIEDLASRRVRRNCKQPD
jgi:hypothetical protein